MSSSKVVGSTRRQIRGCVELRTEWKLSPSGESNEIEAMLPRKASSQRKSDRTANRHR